MNGQGGTPAARFLDALAGRRTWVALGYLLVGAVVPVVTFSVVVTAASLAVGLAVTVIGIPLLLAAAHVVHGCAALERHRAAAVVGADPRPPSRREPVGPGIVARVRAAWSDQATWRELALLVALFPPLYALDVAAFTLWAAVAGLVASPAWFWSIPQEFPDGSRDHGIALGWFPHGPDGEGAIGVFIGDVPTACAVSLVSILLLAGAGLLVRAAAGLHARVALSLAGHAADPMAPARAVLAGPALLPPLAPTLAPDPQQSDAAPSSGSLTSG